MSKNFIRSVAWSTLVLLLLMAAAAVAEHGPRPRTDPARFVMRALRTLDEREPNREAREAQTRGYYEGLLEASALESSWLDWRRLLGREKPAPVAREKYPRVARKDFLYFELPANARLEKPAEPNFGMVTNRHGMVDRDYDVQKPANTHRIAVIGDSIAFGYGTLPGRAFESVLEEDWNARLQPGPVERIEILNFAVSGYRATQLLEVGLEKVPAFRPDVYLVTMTTLSLLKDWGFHIVSLLQAGIDLKYPYLRQVVADAGISAGDSPETMQAKLTRFRWPTLRWVLSELKAHAQREGASLVVAVIPSVHGVDVIDEQFDGIYDLLHEVDVPFLDLLDCFRGSELSQVRVGVGDNHPNEEGHRLIAAAISRAVSADAALRRATLGPSVVID